MDAVCQRTELLNLVKFCVAQNSKPCLTDKDVRLPLDRTVTISSIGRTLSAHCFIKNSVDKTHVMGQIEAEVVQPGDVTVNAGDLIACLSNMSRGPVQISTEGHNARVKSVGMARVYRLRTEDKTKTPDCPEPSGLEFAMPANSLRRLLRVFSAMSTDETRAHINCALFEVSNGVARVASTDGHRLCLTTEEVPHAGDASIRFMVPRQAAAALTRMHFSDMSTVQAMFQVDAAGHRVSAQQGSCRVSFTDVDAQFPPYEHVIPTSCSASFRLSTDVFADTLRAVMVTASDGCNGATLSLRPGALLLDSNRGAAGSAHDELAADYSGEPHHASFDVGYLLDALSSVESDEVTMGMNGALDPCLIEAPGYKCIIMPCRI